VIFSRRRKPISEIGVSAPPAERASSGTPLEDGRVSPPSVLFRISIFVFRIFDGLEKISKTPSPLMGEGRGEGE
jgi:hypothetical protein